MKKRLFAILCIVSLFLAPSCDQARLRDIDDKIKNLEEEDKRILKELSDAIDELEKTLLGKIQESNDRLNGDIDTAVLDMLEYLKKKMDENQDYLETELAARKEQCDETVKALRDRAGDVTDALDNDLDETKARIQKAIADNDEDMRQKLLLVEESIGRAYDCVDAAEANLKKWEATIASFEATGMYDAMDNLQAVMQKVANYDVQSSIDEVEKYAKNFARVNLDKLSKDKLQELKQLVADMDEWMDDAENYASNSESIKSEMESLLDDWRDRADDLYSNVDDISASVLEGYEDILAVYSDYEDLVLSEESEVQAEIDNLYEIYDRILDCSDIMDSGIDDLISVVETMNDMAEEIRSLAAEVEDGSQEMIVRNGRFQAWLDDNPWAYER